MFTPTLVQLKGVDGATYTLTAERHSGPAVLLAPGAKGLDAPTYNLAIDEYPAIDGGFYRFSRAPVREIFLPLIVVGSTRAQMMRLKRRLVKSLNPKIGPVTIQVTEYSDTGVAEPTKAISCYYVSGMEGGEDSGSGWHWSKYGLILRAPFPYFQALNRTFANFLTTTTKPFFGSGGPWLSLDGEMPGDGLQLSANPTWVREVTIENDGDVEVQPRWEIRGPLNSRLSLVRTDEEGVVLQELRLSQPVELDENQVLVIETAHGGQFVRRYLAQEAGADYDPLDGESFWWAYDVTSDMWALEPGENRVGLVIDKPDDMTPEEEADWLAVNSPNVTLSFKATYMGI